MNGADRLEDGYPHGTVAGYTAGCQGGYCPAGNDHGLSCRRAKQLTAGDYRFQRLVKQGLTPAELALEMGLTPETHQAPKARRNLDPDGIENDDEEEVVEQTKVAPTPRDVAPKVTRPEPTADDEKRRRAEVRAWARENGIQIGAKGRIPQAVVVGWLNDDPTLGGTAKPKLPVRRSKKPAAQPPTPPEPVEHEHAAGTATVEGASFEVPILSPDPDAMESALTGFQKMTEALRALTGADAIDERDQAYVALELALTKWAEEQQRRKDAERLARVLAVEVKRLERHVAVADAALGDVAQILRPADDPMTDAGPLHGAHVAARKPWWKRWAS